MEFTLSLSYTSSRAAKRRGDPESLDCFVTMFLATTGYAKVSFADSELAHEPWKTLE